MSLVQSDSLNYTLAPHHSTNIKLATFPRGTAQALNVVENPTQHEV